MTSFPVIALINVETTGYFNEKVISAINQAAIYLHVFLFHILLFQ